jgi:imidazolonepropionase-like amidohydrolase
MKKTSSILTSILIILTPFSSLAQTIKPVEGIRENTPAVYALTNCKIVISPEKTINSGTIVVRDGIITAIGAGVKAPDDAQIRDYKNKTVYPGFIESYLPATPKEIKDPDAKPEPAEPPKDTGKTPVSHWSPYVHPEAEAIDSFKPDEKAMESLHKQGFTSALVVPVKGIFRGQSTLISLGEKEINEEIISPDVAQHVAFDRSAEDQTDFPDSLMGSIAMIRQTLLDTNWYMKANQAYKQNPAQISPEINQSLASLQGVIKNEQKVMFEVDNDLDLLRAIKITDEFSLHPLIRGSGYEYRQLPLIKKSGVTVILPVNFPDQLAIEDPQEAINTSLKDLQHWEVAPENPEKLYEASIPFTLSANGLDKPEKFLENIRLSVKKGLPEAVALDALTRQPAKLLGADKQLGTLENGKIADLLVTDGNIFNPKTKIIDLWVAGKRIEINKQPPVNLGGKWQLVLDLPGGERRAILEINEGDKLEGTINFSGKKIKLTKINFAASRFTALFEAKDLGLPGFVMLNGKVEDTKINGSINLPNGTETFWTAEKLSNPVPDKIPPKEPNLKAIIPKLYLPGGTYSRKANPVQPDDILLKNGTVWTSAKEGKIEQADVLIHSGKIVKIGKNLSAPNKALIIDCKGKHITPGIIDAHSHTGIAGGVNESTQAVTAEVRIQDVIDSYDTAYYNELAGGLTVANLLHGSANPIGGQNAVVKLRWGSNPDEMRFKEAPEGIKFALGENVKQSNWGDNYTTRYPQTRMGVDQLIRDSLKAALDYQKEWHDYNSLSQGAKNRIIPPRRDLELDALSEILNGKRLVHSHSYRQDEIMMLLRVAEDFNFRIATLQHVLEGYKVAEIIAKHGAGASTFTDWWGYKIEVYDAIPYNGALMYDNGIIVSFNSDSDELARRLNTEAGKAVKYGGLSEEEALKFVTINPAKQLKIDKYVGSLEPGKDADIAIWNGDPLSDFTVCEQTWIDGRKYFDIKEDQEIRRETLKERNRLIQKYLNAKNSKDDKDDEDKKDEKDDDKDPEQEQK